MTCTNVQRLGEHVTAALLGQVTPMSAEVAIVAGRGQCAWSAAAARHPANRATIPAEAMTHAVAPEAIADVDAFLVNDAAACACPWSVTLTQPRG